MPLTYPLSTGREQSLRWLPSTFRGPAGPWPLTHAEKRKPQTKCKEKQDTVILDFRAAKNPAPGDEAVKDANTSSAPEPPPRNRNSFMSGTTLDTHLGAEKKI